MQSNTVEVESHPVNFPNFSVEKRTYKSDPFTIKDGRYIGSDGFVVPRDFAEFYERFPDYVRRWVSNHADRLAPKEDLEDWTQDLLIHLYHLPQTSKFREAGNKDIVQTFDPMKHYGANEARFRNYMNLCLANKFRTMRSKRMKDALFRPGNLSLDGHIERGLPLCGRRILPFPFGIPARRGEDFRKSRQPIEGFFRSSWISCGGKTRRFCPH